MDGNAMTNFHLALADEVLSSIEEKKTVKEIWDHLTKLYEATSLHNKIFLKRKLYTLRMLESTSVTEHLNTLNTLFSQLTSLSCKIGEQERAELLLQSLPDSYDQLIINLTNSNFTSLVFDDVAAAVLQEDNRRKNKEDRQVNLQQAEALTTMTTMRGRSTERGQSSSHKHGRSKSRSKKNLKCYNCGKKGHLKKDCWSLNKNSNPQGNTENTSDDGDALCCEASTTVEGRKRFVDIWLIDSRATYHMTSRREWFHHYEPVSGESVYSCNDHALEIIGVGTIKLKMYDGTIKVVRDVFIGALVVLKGEKIAANLYMLKGETLLKEEASVASCSSDSEMLWHKKLGHIKQHRLKFNTSNSRGKSVLELVHSDVWQAPVTSLGGEKYFVSFIDDYSRRCWVHPIKKKKEDIKRQFTVANTPQQNEVAEWMNRTLLERTRAMLRNAGIEKSFWAEAINTALYVMYNSQEISKLDPKSRKCKFLGYADGVKGYCLWDPTAHKVIISRDVIFVEDKLQRKEDDDSAEKSETTQIHVEKEFEQGDSSEAEPTHDEQERESSKAPTTQDGEPSIYQEAINNSDASLWMMAMQEEIEALHKNNTWDLVPLPQGRKPIGNKWVFKIKRNGDDQVERYRARLVVKGYAQKEEQLDVKTTFLHGNLEKEIYMLQPEGPKKDHIEELKAQLAKEFEMKDLGSATKILGMQIHRDRNCKPISTPLPINFKLSSSMSPSSEEERMEMSRVPYASAVGSLMFAMKCTRPDIAQGVGVVSRYMANPGKEHWNTVKRILRYIKGTSNVALYYGGSNLLINGWVSKLQSVVATSTTEAEYVAATQASKEAIWLKMLLEELGHNQEYVEEGTIDMQKIHTKDNIADFMPKAINADKFTWCRSSCGLSETPNLFLHCMSKDKDIGDKPMVKGQVYMWDTKINFVRSTLFFCQARWVDHKRITFDAFVASRDDSRSDVNTQLKNKNVTTDIKVDTNSNLFTTITVDEPAPGLKTIFSFRVPDQRSGKVVQGIISELEAQGALPRSNSGVSSLATCCGPRILI
ncbi:hypothetical protein F3Y22_tig00111783pilonHSYRG00232 [Hibiscus syriacus]|uniref:CCHC-type domain-containing protein n=1 Tax=Hibiscus syriacus TaxID=106335 RepID=A0A6A2XCK4_HIBSY|nr:hypothetical protein F3Y22_tig00111783pilonHSYRG00232 [Hibiscus syriacus]